MNKTLKTILLLVAFALPMAAQAAQDKDATLQKVESKYVCMINDTLFDREQIPVEVNGKTYYGCCPMCKEKLEKSAQARTATDPVSGNTVDKATAIIGAQANGKVHYFENEENLKHYSGGDHAHSDAKQCMQGENCPMHEGMKHPGKDSMHDHKKGMHGGDHGHDHGESDSHQKHKDKH